MCVLPYFVHFRFGLHPLSCFFRSKINHYNDFFFILLLAAAFKIDKEIINLLRVARHSRPFVHHMLCANLLIFLTFQTALQFEWHCSLAPRSFLGFPTLLCHPIVVPCRNVYWHLTRNR